MLRRNAFTALTWAAVALAAALPARAADWPAKPLTMIVPFPAGGSTDAIARLIAQRLGTLLGQPVNVDNRAGAAGNLGTDAVAKAAPDGYTLGLTTSGPLANNKWLYKAMTFDSARDLTPIVLVGEVPLVWVANASAKASNLREFIADARVRNVTLNIGHPGNGSIGHLAAALLASNQKLAATNVPYKGDTPAMTDVMGGTVDLVSAPVTAFIANIQAGKLKGLAVTSKARFPGLPAVPTALEQGIDVEASVWSAVVGPAGLPAPVVSRLNAEINAVLAMPEVRAKLEQYGATVAGGAPQQLAALMAADSAKWKKVIDSAKVNLD